MAENVLLIDQGNTRLKWVRARGAERTGGRLPAGAGHRLAGAGTTHHGGGRPSSGRQPAQVQHRTRTDDRPGGSAPRARAGLPARASR